MADYYHLLGVDPGATKDEIRSAYRAELDALDPDREDDRIRRAELGRAWNVLSDPIQRERYDAGLADGAVGGDDEVEVVDDDEPGPARSGARGAANARPRPEPTVVLPAGMHLAETRPRSLALLFDVSVLAVLYIACFQFLLPSIVQARYPDQVDRIDAITEQIDDLEDNKTKLEDDRSAAEDDDNQERVDALDGEIDAIDERITAKEDDIAEIRNDFLGISYLVAGAVLVLGLVYLVPLTAITGQSFGKRLRQVWVARVDGSAVGWGGAIAHYLPPLALAVFIPQLGLLLALGMIFWSLRDRNRQGFHDKLARTLVVDAPPARP